MRLVAAKPLLTNFAHCAARWAAPLAWALRLVAAVESRSEHPIAQAIVAAAEKRGLSLPPTESFEAVPGFGVSARVEGRKVDVGADRFMI